MSGYSGRRGPNVSQYVANLNTIAPEEVQEPNPDFDLFCDLDIYSEYDNNNVGFNPSLDVSFNSVETPAPTTEASHTLPAASARDAKMDFPFNDDFQFGDFSAYPQPLSIVPPIQNPLSAPQSYSVGTAYASPTSAVSPVTPGFDAGAGKKRKADAAELSSQPATDEQARNAAEEDKRRRNTAASARFRIKKKQREQALEASAREMKERVSVLETRIAQLETENTWLKGLITEKNGGKASPSDIQARLSKREESERSNGGRTDGVGTDAGKA
ncbi:regulatory protein cys-3 [Bimuria novae-zelandiae CBS 107.79]|uniref:Regulatory protein cys-3 n=1 Tax=Bimuria novae-zelandiae CBS 107.79 TaxID=1447943 RepID=A0A6A5VF05_9PLEO|nr:regulatory protein cys-3 [Bimuria novae-zelandiae CBS 107.79]